MDLDRNELSEKIIRLIRSKKEGKTWDFKASWKGYENRAELLLDVLCMANNPTPDDAYIIIGIDEKNGFRRTEGLDLKANRKDFGFEQVDDLTDWLYKIKFTEHNVPSLDLIMDLLPGIDVIIIKSTSKVPYSLREFYKHEAKATPACFDYEDIKGFLISFDNKEQKEQFVKTEQIEKLAFVSKETGAELDNIKLENIRIRFTPKPPHFVPAGKVFVRRMGSNSPRDTTATPPELEELYKKRFGLNLSIRERFNLLLSNKDDWDLLSGEQPPTCSTYLTPTIYGKNYIVHKYCPDFFIETEWMDSPFFGRFQLFPTFCRDWCITDHPLHFGVLKLFYGRFLVNKFWILIIDGIGFVEPSHVCNFAYFAKTLRPYDYFYFIENDVKFNINNVLKKVCAHQRYQFGKLVTVNPPEDAFIGDDGMDEPRRENHCKEQASLIHEHMKKYIIYFKDEEEKNKYQDYLVKNKEAIQNGLENLNLNDDIFRESLSRRFSEKMDSSKIDLTVRSSRIRKFLVNNFYAWKFSRLLSKVMFGCLADYLCALFCDCVKYTIVPRCRKDFNCHLPDFIAYFPVESGLIFRYECDECIFYYCAEIKEYFYPSHLFELKGVTISVGDCKYGVELIGPGKSHSPNKFYYFYFFKNSMEYEINNIILRNCLTSSEADDKIRSRFEECKKVFDSYMIHFKDENEKREFDKYLETNKEVVEDVNSFYEKNREELEKDCKGKICKLNNKLCPTEDDIKKMVRVGVFAEKVKEIFDEWKERGRTI